MAYTGVMRNKAYVWPFEYDGWWMDIQNWKPPKGLAVLGQGRDGLFGYTIDYHDAPGPGGMRIKHMNLRFTHGY